MFSRFRLLHQVVDLLDVGQLSLKVDLEILKQAVVEVEDPAVDDGVLVLGKGLLDGGGLDDVAALLEDVELDEAVVALGLVGDSVELLLVQAVDVADVTQPGVEQAEVLGGHGGLDTAAAVVAADDDVLDAEVADGVVDDGHDIEVGVADEVGDVAVDEGLAGLEAGDLLGGDARVAAADPEILGVLALSEGGEEAGILLGLLGGPGAVVVEEAVVRLLEILGDVLLSHGAPVIGVLGGRGGGGGSGGGEEAL